VNRTFVECRTDCFLPQVRNASVLLVDGVRIVDAFRDLLVNDVEPLLSCEPIRRLLDNSKV